MVLLGLKEKSRKCSRSFGYILVKTDSFSKSGWTVPLEKIYFLFNKSLTGKQNFFIKKLIF